MWSYSSPPLYIVMLWCLISTGTSLPYLTLVVCSIAGRKGNPYLRMEFLVLGSFIPTVMQVEEGNESSGVQ
jgi:hypothetical protein